MKQTVARKCTACKIEKDETEFHRRGVGRQNICKSCRAIASQTPPQTHRQPAEKRSQNEIDIIGSRIAKLEPRLRVIARKYASDPHEAEDIYQHICEKLLKSAKVDDTDTNMLVIAKFRAGDYKNMERVYTYYVGSESEISNTQESEDVSDVFEMYVNDGSNPESEIIKREAAEAIKTAISALAPENRSIISLLISGKSKVEIAKEMGVTRQAINNRLNTIASQLSSFGISS